MYQSTFQTNSKQKIIITIMIMAVMNEKWFLSTRDFLFELLQRL